MKRIRTICLTVLFAGGITLAAPSSHTHVAIFLYDGVELLDFAGPGEVFAATPGFNVYTVALTSKTITSQRFVKIKPQYTIDNAPQPDVIVLPGGATAKLTGEQRLMEWLKLAADRPTIMLSVCTGAAL